MAPTYTVTPEPKSAFQTQASVRFPRRCVDASEWLCRVQEMRLIASLLEANWGVVINGSQLRALEPSLKFHPYKIRTGCTFFEKNEVMSIDVQLDHVRPWTQLNDVGQPLFFPEWLANLALQDTSQRDILISFSGNMTASRRIKVLELIQVYSFTFLHQCSFLFSRLTAIKPKRLTAQLSYLYLLAVSNYTNIRVLNSQTGRSLSGKILDLEYWAILCRSQFVFCPSGDFGWTYRFYEAILSGACPILEDDNAEFSKGFFFIKIGDPLPDLKDISKHLQENREKAFQLLCGKDALSRLGAS